MRKIHIITKHDLIKYPPTQSLIWVLLELGFKIAYIGICSDKKTQNDFEEKGVEFIPIHFKIYKGQINKFIGHFKYKRKISQYIKSKYSKSNDIIWFDYTETAYFLHEILKGTKYLVHFYEYVNPINNKYKYVYPTYNFTQFVRNAIGVIHCEYNRAHILRGICGLEKLPFILPNKPYFNEITHKVIPQDIIDLATKIKEKTFNKKIILYQGIFDSKERRLEEFCEAINELPNDFTLIVMGEGSDYYKKLKLKFESERIIFIPFIKPPYHLLITELAHLGILTYFPNDKSYAGVLNPLYCAPNKIFEYGLYGIPMISNDLPGIKSIFNEYKCGKIVEYPICKNNIKETIIKIFENYNTIKGKSKQYYDSIDIKSIIYNIVSSI